MSAANNDGNDNKNASYNSSVTPNKVHIDSKKPHKGPQWREALAGAGAGAFSRSVMAPLERLKLLQQLQFSTTELQHQSVWRILSKVYQEQGWYSFWRGNGTAVLRVAGTASINFTCLDYYKRAVVAPLLKQQSWTTTPTSITTSATSDRTAAFFTSLIAGGLAGATSTTLLYPMEFARTRLAMDMGRDDLRRHSNSNAANSAANTNATIRPRQYQGMWDVVRQITHSDGIAGLYRGYGIALVGGIFYRVLYLGGYDALKTELHHYHATNVTGTTTASSSSSASTQQPQSISVPWLQRILAAQTISLTAGTLSYPLDSVRRRMMMQSGKCRPDQVPLYRNSWHCLVQIARTEGIGGFYLGLGPNVLRSVGGALMLVAYDALRTLL